MYGNPTNLPISVSDFSTIIEDRLIYVDKTKIIADLIDGSLGKWLFLSRPRRFGKTLLLSTLEYLFRGEKDLFHNLYIENEWDWNEKYNVLHLDFSNLQNCKTSKDFLECFGAMSFDACQEAGITMEPISEAASPGQPIRQLIKTIKAQPKQSLVLLIDEYDAPLTHNLDNPELFREFKSLLNTFFSKLKGCTKNVRLFFMTDIIKIGQANNFSGFNNFVDLSLNPRAGELLGYTEGEIEKYFSSELARAAEVEKTTVDDILKRLKKAYDGYCFDSQASTHVFAPWSVLLYLAQPQLGFQNYWFESAGKPTGLINYLKRNHLWTTKAASQEEIYMDIGDFLAPNDISDMSPEEILTQMGYLTIRSVDASSPICQNESLSGATLHKDFKCRSLPNSKNPLLREPYPVKRLRASLPSSTT